MEERKDLTHWSNLVERQDLDSAYWWEILHCLTASLLTREVRSYRFQKEQCRGTQPLPELLPCYHSDTLLLKGRASEIKRIIILPLLLTQTDLFSSLQSRPNSPCTRSLQQLRSLDRICFPRALMTWRLWLALQTQIAQAHAANSSPAPCISTGELLRLTFPVPQL